ncbi:MAG: ATP-binding cassette domain-containing protein [Streptococcaceae bacterium]|nr:ATP-binding cassette domain-containing protein [Streptococcaceae bacterium]
MSNLKIEHLNFSYGAHVIFENAEINIDESWRLGLVGRNGRGKTTLLRVLEKSAGARKFAYFPQTIVNADEMTIDVLSALTEGARWEIERELSLLAVDLEVLWRPFVSLSGGEQTKCLLAMLFLSDDAFALIDEPTNHLDLPSRKSVASYLARKHGFIVVSHDRDFLNAVSDHTLVIERTKLVLYQGNYSVYEEEKKHEDAREQRENNQLKGEISRLRQAALAKENWARAREKTKDASADSGFVSARAARAMKKSKNLEKRMTSEISKKESLLKNVEKIGTLQLNFVPSFRETLLSLADFSVSADGKTLFEPLTFELKKHEILALAGPNGSGKTQCLKQLPLSEHIKVSYVRQIFQNTGNLRDFARENQLNYELFLSNLRKLGLSRRHFDQPIETLSQGQQKKVELARSLSEPAELYIWDEPLNYLDITNHVQLTRLLTESRPTMLLVEHDTQFIETIATKTLFLKK